jgi:hypothetical protein
MNGARARKPDAASPLPTGQRTGADHPEAGRPPRPASAMPQSRPGRSFDVPAGSRGGSCHAGPPTSDRAIAYEARAAQTSSDTNLPEWCQSTMLSSSSNTTTKRPTVPHQNDRPMMASSV